MRTDIESRIVEAFGSAGGVAVRAQLNVLPTRHFSQEVNTDYKVSFADGAGIAASPLAQDTKLVDGLAISVYVDEDVLKMGSSFSEAVALDLGGASLSANGYCRPAIGVVNNEHVYVYYVYDGSGGTGFIYRADVVVEKILAGEADNTLSNELVSAAGKNGALHAVEAERLIYFYVDDGGVRVSHLEYDGSWTTTTWQGRFMHLTTVYEEGEADDQAVLNYSAAVINGTDVFCYLSMPDGDVRGVQYFTAEGVWSDSFEAVPMDMSKFMCANAMVVDETIFLTGMFQRVDEEDLFISDSVYGMILASSDGKNFSLDRTTVFTSGTTSSGSENEDCASRFWGLYSEAPDSDYGVAGAGMIYAASGAWICIAAHAGFTEQAGLGFMVEDVTAVRGELEGGFTIGIPNTDKKYDEQFNLHDLVDIDLGARTSLGVVEYFRLMRCIVTQVREGYADGERQLQISVEPLSVARLESMTHPFNLELRGKESIYDNLTTLENFDRAAEEGYLIYPLCVDFWDAGDKVAPKTHDATETYEYTSGDFVDALDLRSYPVIGELPFQINLYGWSRSGNPTPYEGGTGDQPSDLDAPNDIMICRLYIMEDGEERTVDISTAYNGGRVHFPQTWYRTGYGDYPVVLEASEEDGLSVGDVISRVGMIFSNTEEPNTAETVFFAERVEMPAISMKVKSYDATWGKCEDGEDLSRCIFEFVTSNGGTWDENTHRITWGNSDGWDNMFFKIRAPYDAIDGAVHVKVKCIHLEEDSDQTCKIMSSSDPYLPTCTGNTSSPAWSEGVSQWLNGTRFPAGIDFNDGAYFVLSGGWKCIDNIFEIEEIKWGLTYSPWTETTIWSQEGDCPGGGEGAVNAQELQRVGVPVVYFAQKPYYTVNCAVAAMYKLAGDAYGGVLCLGVDGDNYIAARASPEAVELIKVRGSSETILASEADTFPSLAGWIKLTYIDGVFSVRIQDVYTRVWDEPIIEYEWTEADGALSIDKDISHVGIYALRDSPYVQICGFDPKMGTNLAVLPMADEWDEFEATGSVRIESNVYSYTGKVSAALIQGPYQGRNVSGRYDYSNNGESYSGNAAEFTRFEWISNADHHDDLAGEYLATDTGVAWLISEVDYKPFIYTKKVQVFLKNRGRFFSGSADGNVIGMSIPVWITHALTGLTLTTGEETTHGKRVSAFFVGDTELTWLAFAASSGKRELTDKDMLKRIAAMARAEASFPGDIEVSSKGLTTSWWEVAA